MQRILGIFIFALAGLVCAAVPAVAHPHVFVTMKSEIMHDAEGRITGIRHAWTFDDMFSTYATQGLDAKEKGAFTREELAPLAEVNVTSLKEFDYFTQGKLNGQKTEFGEPVDYFLEFKDQTLTLHFTLPLKTPAKVKDLTLEIFDPIYFVSFGLAEKDAVTLGKAPPACKLTVINPDGKVTTESKPLAESFFSQLDKSNPFGAQFANRISVKCP